MRWEMLLAVRKWLILLLGLTMGYASHAGKITPAAPTDAGPTRILVLGDSLSAEYGLPRGSGWVTLIEQRLAQREQAYQIRNASISGDTTDNGLQRLPTLLQEFAADIVILQLGANDGLRGLPVPDMKRNLRRLVELCQEHGAQVLVVGQQIPPNYGRRYASDFQAAFATVANDTGSALVPFMLEGIAAEATMFQDDGLHPTVQAQAHIADTIWQYLKELL